MIVRKILALVSIALCLLGTLPASSHMDAPLVTLDPAANTTDVYAFISAANGQQYLTTALAVYPHEEPGIGPNKYNFDDAVLYEIHVCLGDDLPAGRATLSYQFRFTTAYKSQATILQSYLGVVESVGDANQNLTQTYTVTRVDRRNGSTLDLTAGTLMVPPNNQGIATPYYNLANNGENPAKPGVSTAEALDRYTSQGIYSIGNGHMVFAGQRDDGFYGDIQAVFDLLQLRDAAQDSQGGFNVHTIALNIPLEELGGSQQVAGVYATTSRRNAQGQFVQVGRQGNPLFAEAFVAITDKDRYNQSSPELDATLFSQYATTPELAALINLILFGGNGPALETDRTDLAGIFVPDVIKVDLSTGPARLAGPPDDEGFSRLSVFGGDVLTSTVQPGLPGFPTGTIPGGWPNGRRFGDDVVDIGVTAVISDLRGAPLVINGPAGDSLDSNDLAYNKVFPYAGTPLNGRRHAHESVLDAATLDFAHFGNGQGFTSDIVLTNSSTSQAVQGSLEFTDGEGQPLEVGIVAGPGIVPKEGARVQASSRVDFSIPIAGSVTISTDGLGAVVSGAARITSQGELGGVIRFSIPGIGIAGVQVSQPVTGFTAPVRRTSDGINTGIAFRNLESQPVDLDLQLLNSDGSQRARTQIVGFAANGQSARFVDQLFDGLQAPFQGTLVVRATGGRVAAMALELGRQPGQFTTLPVNPLP